MCPGGEIGIHVALRWLWEQSRAGSSPVLGTKKKFLKVFWRFLFLIIKNPAVRRGARALRVLVEITSRKFSSRLCPCGKAGGAWGYSWLYTFAIMTTSVAFSAMMALITTSTTAGAFVTRLVHRNYLLFGKIMTEFVLI